MQPTEGWGHMHKSIDYKPSDNIPEENGQINGGMVRENSVNSFDNPSFNVTYTFETAI